ncbi:MAG: hypothetical protein K1W06_11435 [Lachnospiraceae bacterium]
MKYLILMSNDEETFYDLKDINKICSDYAQNLDQEVDLKEIDIKPLEMLTVIYFNNGSTAAFRTANLEMYFG